jgi:D-amino-acid dehydrogenase
VSDKQSVIVIGGGIVGCSAAYYLANDGWHVTLLEAGRIGGGCSHGNCGFICPSHVLPLTAPGAVWHTLRRAFSKNSPITIAPRWDPALWGWFLRFALGCREPTMLRTAAARHALLDSSMRLYRELVRDEALNVEWQDRGLLIVYKSERHLETFGKIAERLNNEFGIATTRYDGSQLAKIEPALRSGLAGAWHYQDDAHLRPDRLMAALKNVLLSRGVEIHEGAAVEQIDVEQGRARAITTSQGTFLANGLVVVAAGAETPTLSKALGCRIPIQPGKGYSITMPRPAHAPSVPMIFEEYHVAVTPWPSGLRIGSTMEFAGYDRRINRRRIVLFKRAAAEYLVEPLGEFVEEEWCGWRPMTCDDLPCIGRAPKAANVIVAAGHGMIGLATGPATGKLVAELASEREPHVDPAPYSLGRFM